MEEDPLVDHMASVVETWLGETLDVLFVFIVDLRDAVVLSFVVPL